MIYDEIRAMYTAYIERVAGFARKEYLRTLSHRSQEVFLEDQSEEILALVEDRYFPDEFELAESRLSQTISELPLLRRQIISMLFMEQLSAPEIAERLGCSVSYVYNEKHRALRKIRNMMEDDDHEQ